MRFRPLEEVIVSERRRRWAELTTEQRAQLEVFRARRAGTRPKRGPRKSRFGGRSARNFPPAAPDDPMMAALTMLRRERERLGLSPSDVAQRSGLDRATISKLETGKAANPTIETLRRYALALGKRLSWSVEDLGPTKA
jgi:DNA-binding XRE family transcriptional regulator